MTEELLGESGVGRGMGRAFGLWPWGMLALYVLGAACVWFSFGRWPRAYRDNPSGILAEAGDHISLIAIFGGVIVTPLLGLAFVARQLGRRRTVLNGWMASALYGSLVFFLVVYVDSFGYAQWLFD